jgi:hypothetical protein
MECLPFGNFFQIVLHIHELVSLFCAFGPIGDIMTAKALLGRLHKTCMW